VFSELVIISVSIKLQSAHQNGQVYKVYVVMCDVVTVLHVVTVSHVVTCGHCVTCGHV